MRSKPPHSPACGLITRQLRSPCCLPPSFGAARKYLLHRLHPLSPAPPLTPQLSWWFNIGKTCREILGQAEDYWTCAQRHNTQAVIQVFQAWYKYTNPHMKKKFKWIYTAAKQKQLLNFLLYLPALSILQTGAELFTVFFERTLCLHKKSEAHALLQSSCFIFLEWCSYDKPTTSMTPCIHHWYFYQLTPWLG